MTESDKVTKLRKPTTKQVKFAKAVVATDNLTESAKLAGYKGNRKTLGQMGYENMNKPEVIMIINKEKANLAERFKEEAHNAFQVILDIINNEQISPHARLIACKDLLDRAGYKPTDKTEVTGELLLSTAHTRAIAERARGLIANGQKHV